MKRKFIIAVSLLLACSYTLCGQQNDEELYRIADSLHNAMFTIDTHIDTPICTNHPEWDYGVEKGQVTFPLMKKGGLDAALFAYTMVSGVINGQIAMALLPVVAILNYFIFFWDDLMDLFRRASGRVSHHTNHQTINFKKAQRQVQERKGYLHKCSVCGITDADNPNMEFRYCSKCNGYYCYCMDHINNHTHVQ